MGYPLQVLGRFCSLRIIHLFEVNSRCQLYPYLVAACGLFAAIPGALRQVRVAYFDQVLTEKINH